MFSEHFVVVGDYFDLLSFNEVESLLDLEGGVEELNGLLDEVHLGVVALIEALIT